MQNHSERFTTEQRILKNKDYQKVTRLSVADTETEKKHSTYFLAFIKPSEDKMRTFSRLGITVSKRVSKKAVDRNWVKRIVREKFRKHLITLQPYDIVVIAKPAANARSDKEKNTAVQKDIEKVFNRILHASSKTPNKQQN